MNPALDFAADGGQLKIAELLVENGADVNQKDSSGGTALYHAVHFGGVNANGEHGSVEVAKFLLDKGADVNATFYHHMTALMIAANQRNRTLVEMLIERHADVNMKDREGDTALTLARRRLADHGDKKFQVIADILIAHGAK